MGGGGGGGGLQCLEDSSFMCFGSCFRALAVALVSDFFSFFLFFSFFPYIEIFVSSRAIIIFCLNKNRRLIRFSCFSEQTVKGHDN